MKIIQKLEKSRIERVEYEQQDSVKEVMELLEQDRSFGNVMDNAFPHLSRQTKAARFSGRHCFTGAEIKKVCDRYGMRLLKSSYLKQPPPPEAVKKLYQAHPKVDSENIFILAPSNAFKLETRKDPILFVRLNGSRGRAAEDDQFTYVSHWGSDFNKVELACRRITKYAPVWMILSWVGLFLSFFILKAMPKVDTEEAICILLFPAAIILIITGSYIYNRETTEWNSGVE